MATLLTERIECPRCGQVLGLREPDGRVRSDHAGRVFYNMTETTCGAYLRSGRVMKDGTVIRYARKCDAMLSIDYGEDSGLA